MKKKLIKSCIWSVSLYGSEAWTLRKNGERVVNAFETWRWRRMLKIKWTDRITNDEDFKKAKEERLLLKILRNRRHSWIEHTIRHNEFVVNILEGAISGKKAMGRPRLQYFKQVDRNTGADSYTAMRRMACNNSRWKAANQSQDRRIIIIRRRRMKKAHSDVSWRRGATEHPRGNGDIATLYRWLWRARVMALLVAVTIDRWRL